MDMKKRRFVLLNERERGLLVLLTGEKKYIFSHVSYGGKVNVEFGEFFEETDEKDKGEIIILIPEERKTESLKFKFVRRWKEFWVLQKLSPSPNGEEKIFREIKNFF